MVHDSKNRDKQTTTIQAIFESTNQINEMKTLTIPELKNNVFSGEDSFGRKYELAIDGNRLFTRNYEFNGYGMAWAKWQPLNSFSGEFYLQPATEFYPARERLKWGWGVDATGYKTRLRLPKQN